jgi:energy-coupling factor transporter ATP-binding protein EcfA2
MKTEITRFCESLLRTLTDLRPALAEAAEKIEKRSEFEEPLSVLNDVRARLRSLSEKLANQHAYLLIFGPLKSGKSTLMNAISGAYVSEVTSLPGYPALVFVQHASEPHFSVTRYNGRESVFADGRVLKDVIADSHVALAEQVRAAELRGEEFDPRQHFTEAVRRIDVKIPVESLAESSTVLVDTPGLYSRMNFSYDLVTREFRDSAACAVFVVKTDNLFLEQVFGEFNQLLNLFSRIFLVVNVDSGKRDLQADGTLRPSAESEDPQRIIEAFKTLSMAGPFRKAFEQGRVRIHAVDLLNAASTFLSREAQPNGSSNGHHAPPNARGKDAFDAFQRDLTEYLNSSDYTREFIRDSLRQSDTLGTEVQEVFQGEEMTGLRAGQEAVAAEIAAIDERVATLDRLLRVDWSATFEEVRIENARRSLSAAKAKAGELGKSLHGALDRWYEASDSLKSLEQQHWNPLLRSAGVALADDNVQHLRRAVSTPVGGASPTPETMIDLHAVNFDLAPIGQAALPELHTGQTTEPFRINVKHDAVPVKKSFADWIFFRSADTVAHRLFGDDRAQEIAPEIKLKRLPETSRAAFLGLIDNAVGEKFPELPVKTADSLLEHYIGKFCECVIAGLTERRQQTVQERAAKQAPFEENARIANAMQALHEQVGKVRAEILSIAEKENVLPLVTDVSAPAAPIPATETPAPTLLQESATA